jgi:hypothetical protein
MINSGGVCGEDLFVAETEKKKRQGTRMGQQNEMYDRPQTRPNISSPAQLNPTK